MLSFCMATLNLCKNRRLSNRKSDIKTDTCQHNAHQKWDAPTPRKEAVHWHERGHRGKSSRPEHDTRRDPRLRVGTIETAASLWGVLDCHKHRAGPLAPNSKALHETHQNEKDRCPNSDAGIGRQEPDYCRGQPHRHKRQHEGRLASDPVAVVASDEPADRACDKPHSKRPKRCNDARRRAKFGEKSTAED